MFVIVWGPGYIDLSKRRVEDADVVKGYEKYHKSKQVFYLCFFLF